MTRVEPTPAGADLVMPLEELLIAQHCVANYADLVGPDPVQGGDEDDPLAAWEREFAAQPDDLDEETDPISARLFPNAYPDDPRASAEFRRYTEQDLRRRKAADALVVAQALYAGLYDLAGEFSGSYEDLAQQVGEREARVEVRRDQLDVWLRTLTGIRLVYGVELEIDEAEDLERLEQLPDDDPRALQVQIFEWLGWLTEELLRRLGAG